jgi:hypothetical protein
MYETVLTFIRGQYIAITFQGDLGYYEYCKTYHLPAQDASSLAGFEDLIHAAQGN